MIYTLVVYVHLLATCAAIGTIVITDLRLMAKMLDYRVVIQKPARLETIMISVALALLYATGAALVLFGMQNNPEYLANPKLQAKLILVLLLTANAFFLHRRIFPILRRAKPVYRWRYAEWSLVATSVSLSNSLWFFCAFLGIARAWNNVVSLKYVLLIFFCAWAITYFMVNAVLMFAARDARQRRRDWVDAAKASLRHLSKLTDRAR
jgi:hypothetical protein